MLQADPKPTSSDASKVHLEGKNSLELMLKNNKVKPFLSHTTSPSTDEVTTMSVFVFEAGRFPKISSIRNFFPFNLYKSHSHTVYTVDNQILS